MTFPLRANYLPALLPLVLAGTRTPAPAASRAEAGRITGSVELSSALTVRRPRFRVYSDVGPGSVPPSTPQGGTVTGEMRNVVVYVEAIGRSDSMARRVVPGVMAQVNERFEPHVLPVLQGARVEFPNRDDVYHNVFSLSSARSFDLGRYPKGASKAVTFGKTGVVQVFCHIHSDMSAIVLVLQNAHYATPDSTGQFVLDGVPAGEYSIVGWHERTKPVTQRIRVIAGQTTAINFRLPLTQRDQ